MLTEDIVTDHNHLKKDERQVAEALFADGLCLPSGPAMSIVEWSNLTDAESARVVGVVQRGWQLVHR